MACEQDDSSAGGQAALQLDDPADVAGVALSARFLDFGPDRVQFAAEFFNVGGCQVRVLLDVGDCHELP